MKLVKRVLGLLVVLLVVLVGSLFLIPADRLANIAADQIRNATGRDVTISGDVSMTLWPVIGAKVGGLEISNADWSEQGPMLTAQNAALGLDAAALLGGEIRITNIEATSPTIRLQSKADGRASWEFTDASGDAQIETRTDPGETGQPLTIARLLVTDATLIYDAEGSDLVEYSGVDLTLDWPERTGPARIDAVLRPAGQDVSLQATIDGFSGFITGENRPVNVTLANSAGRASLVGQAGISGDVKGKLALDISSTDGFLRQLGLPGADLPKGLGQSMSVTASLALTRDRLLSLRDLVADLDGNALRGIVDASLNGVPQIDADLNAGALDLRGLTGSSDSAGASDTGGTASAAGWSKAPVDASGLAAFNGDIALRADSIDLGSLKFGPTRTTLRNDRSRMVFALHEVAAYSGAVSGEFVMNNRSGLSVGGKLAARGVQMQGVLADLAGITRLTGAADARVSFLGVGQSVDAIMRSLSGDGSLTIGRGTIEGIDLDRLMRSGDTGAGTTVFDSLSATFSMAAGDLRNDDLLLLLPSFEARGSGRVGLGAQDLDYTFVPKALRGNDGKGIAIPVRIRGPWSNPRVQPDLEAALDLNFKEEKEKVEQKVKQEIQKKVGDAVGVQTEEGQSVEDAIEKKLEKELERGLLKLFD